MVKTSNFLSFMSAGVGLFATAVLAVALIMSLGSTRYPLGENDLYTNEVFPRQTCTTYNNTLARCQSCVVSNATANLWNCTTCDATFTKPPVFNNCSSVIQDRTAPVPPAPVATPSAIVLSPSPVAPLSIPPVVDSPSPVPVGPATIVDSPSGAVVPLVE